MPFFRKKQGFGNFLTVAFILVDMGYGTDVKSAFRFVKPPIFRVSPFRSTIFADLVRCFPIYWLV